MFTGLLIGLALQVTLMAEPLLNPGDIVGVGCDFAV